jgi:hypothetical protein
LTPEIRERAERRWHDIRRASPELAQAVAMQRELVAHADTVRDLLQSRGVARPVIPRSVLVARLASGTCVLAGEVFPVPYELLAPSVDACCAILERGAAGAGVRPVRRAVAEGRLDVPSLLAASLSRDARAIDEASRQLGYAPDVLWLIGELATAPYAQHLQQRLFGDSSSRVEPVAAALRSWKRGNCPACGSWPAFGERRPDGRWLRCSFCALDWPRPAGCSYCGAAAVTTHPVSPQGAFDACSRCGAYLKSLAADAPVPLELLPVEDLASHALDRAAAAAGYGRPSMQPSTSAHASALDTDASAS